MKKLMFAAAMACVAGICAADVTSQNVVGYGPTALGKDTEGVLGGFSFVPVSGDSVDLFDLVVTGYGEGECEGGEVVVQPYNVYGGPEESYYWYDFIDEDGNTVRGWFYIVIDGDDMQYFQLEKGAVVKQRGEGFWVTSAYNTWAIQSSGEVPTADIPVALGKDTEGLIVVNPTPVAVDLVDCYVDGYGEGECEGGEVVVQPYNVYGGPEESYYWYDFIDEDGNTVRGWFYIVIDGDDMQYFQLEKGVISLDPGTGVWATSAFNTWKFNFPGVEIK